MDILPCPLCGHPVNFHAPEWEIRMDGSISCYNCDLTMDIPHSGHTTLESKSTVDEERFKAAVARWNTRTPNLGTPSPSSAC